MHGSESRRDNPSVVPHPSARWWRRDEREAWLPEAPPTGQHSRARRTNQRNHVYHQARPFQRFPQEVWQAHDFEIPQEYQMHWCNVLITLSFIKNSDLYLIIQNCLVKYALLFLGNTKFRMTLCFISSHGKKGYRNCFLGQWSKHNIDWYWYRKYWAESRNLCILRINYKSKSQLR